MAVYPKAQWVGTSNQGGPIGPIRLGVFHLEDGTEAGTNSWFQNPAAQVSAHFGVGKDGAVYQFVDTAFTAWAEMGYNGEAISIEHEGVPGDSLTPAQIASDVPLIRWIHATTGLPTVRNSDPAGTGWIGHGELGVAGGNHPDCPGPPILAQLPAILEAVAAVATVPPPSPHKEIRMFIATDGHAQFVVEDGGKRIIPPNTDGELAALAATLPVCPKPIPVYLATLPTL